MLGEIQVRDAALQSAHDNLEKRVADRTRELEQEVAERGRVETKLRQQLARTNLLNSITRAIMDRQDLDEVVNIALRQWEEHLAIDFGRVSLFDLESSFWTMTAGGSSHATKTSDILGSPVPIGPCGLDPCRAGEMIHIDGEPTGCSDPKSELRSKLYYA